MKNIFLFILGVLQISLLTAADCGRPSLRHRSRGSSVEFGGQYDGLYNLQDEVDRARAARAMSSESLMPSAVDFSKALFAAYGKKADDCPIISPSPDGHEVSPKDMVKRCSSGGEGCAASPSPNPLR